MNEREIIDAAAESLRNPALLARCEAAKDGGSEGLLADFSEAPEGEADLNELFDRYLDRGEIGAAQYLQRRSLGLPVERIVRSKGRLTQEIQAMCLALHDALIQIKETSPDVAADYEERLRQVEVDPVLLGFRHGPAGRLLGGLVTDLETRIQEDRTRMRGEAEALQPAAAGNPDVELALRRFRAVLDLPEGLGSAARYLRVAGRARDGALTAEDIRALHEGAADGARLVRPWSDVRAAIGESATPGAVAELLTRDVLPAGLRIDKGFDRDHLRELVISMHPESDGPIRTERVADRLFRYIGIVGEGDRRPAGTQSTTGTKFPFSIPAPRHRELAHSGRPLVLCVPLHGTESRAIGKLMAAPHQGSSAQPLHVLVYPGVADPSRSLPQHLGLSVQELPFVDLVDILRLGEVPLARRADAFQQVIIARMPSLGNRTFQTGGPVASELFRGRSHVIDALMRPRGPTVLFSGRMMGKSSVLSRIREKIAANDRPLDRPLDRHRCVLLSAASGNLLDPLLEQLISMLYGGDREAAASQRTKLAPTTGETPNQRQEKEKERIALARRVIEKIIAKERLTLLVDEADRFAEKDAGQERDVSLAWLLRDLENHAPEQLRIVFAGFQSLHHEVIAGNGAFANWFGQEALGPLDRDDAVALIKEPLADFGISFVSPAGVERILEFTGGYPLLIQEVCAHVVKRALARRGQHPKPGDEVVLVRAGEVEAVCREDSLRSRLLQVLSLNLNDYPRLKLVTYLILRAGAYPGAGGAPAQGGGFRVEHVQSMLMEWYGDRLSEYFSEASLPGLIDELTALGLIARQGDNSYRFLNRTFADMLVAGPAFEDEFVELLERVANPQDDAPRRYWNLPNDQVECLKRPGQAVLLVGLPGTLKSETLRLLYLSDEGSGSLVVSDSSINSLDALIEWLRKRLRDNRTSLSVADLCVRHQVGCLVLDDVPLSLDALAAVAKALQERGIGLTVSIGVAALRDYLRFPNGDFQIVPVRRLRPQDVRAWASHPARGTGGGRDVSVILDQQTARSLCEATCGYFPLLRLFRDHCVRTMTRALEYYPGASEVEQFRGTLSTAVVRKALVESLNEVEVNVLREIVDMAEELGGRDTEGTLTLDAEWAQQVIVEKSRDEESHTSRMRAFDLLVHLDLVVETTSGNSPRYRLDNAALLDAALAA